MEGVWREQIRRHPSMEPQDVMKLCYQSAFGAEHLLEDLKAAEAYFMREFDQVQSVGNEYIDEFIGNDIYRVNLGAWKELGLLPEWLFRMFAETASRPHKGGKEQFQALVRGAGELVAEGAFRFGGQAWDAFLRNYPLTAPVPVHHSEGYRQVERPAYRLVCQDFMLVPLLTEICEKIKKQDGFGNCGCCVIAIDGPCASGKTTVAEHLATVTGAGIVHMDDFFLPAALRTEERLGEPGGNVHYERFLEEVIPELKVGKDFSYRRFDCGRMELGEEHCVACESGIVVVEGSYSCHPKFGEYMDIRVFCDVTDSEEQLARIEQRDGAEAVEMFIQRWIPMEKAYLEAYHIRERADLLL